jgi:hypothetical protein
MHGTTSNSWRFTWLIAALLLAPAVYSQQEPEPAEEEVGQSEPAADSGQVEANEDIYRQFMELKDGLQQRAPSPQDSWQSRSRLQKLDELPEDSQKHLRNQLREVIVEGGAWQPGDQDKDYPYVPSEAARENARLQRQEAEAWGELLDSYHAREAQIYANAARSQAASATVSLQREAAQPGTEGAEGVGRESQGAQAGAPAIRAETRRDSFAPGAQAGSQAPGEQGVAQSAMDFLQQSGYQAGSGQATQQGQQGQQAQMAQQVQQTQAGQESRRGQMDQQGNQGQQGQAGQPAVQAQRSESTQAAMADSRAASGTSNISLASQPRTGTEQSAMQYLQQTASQADSAQQAGEAGRDGGEAQAAEQRQADRIAGLSEDPQAPETASGEPATEGVSQSALEYLSGEGAADSQADTLSIQDLLNAGGLGAEPAEDEEPPKMSAKDG